VLDRISIPVRARPVMVTRRRPVATTSGSEGRGWAMLSEELRALAAPTLAEVVRHPFWTGLADGTLPGSALTHFVEQDTNHLLPTFGRVFAGAAAHATENRHTALLAGCASATVESAPRLRGRLAELAGTLAVTAPAAGVPADPTTAGYCAFGRAASAEGMPAALGALLPFMWFHLDVCDALLARQVPGSRYLPWLAEYRPPDVVWQVVRSVLDVVDELAARWSAAQRAALVDHFGTAARYEWAFAEAGLRTGGDEAFALPATARPAG
jgi:thiaminase/transcriptional activator TenA